MGMVEVVRKRGGDILPIVIVMTRWADLPGMAAGRLPHTGAARCNKSARKVKSLSLSLSLSALQAYFPRTHPPVRGSRWVKTIFLPHVSTLTCGPTRIGTEAVVKRSIVGYLNG